jgi:hypothetical protein
MFFRALLSAAVFFYSPYQTISTHRMFHGKMQSKKKQKRRHTDLESESNAFTPNKQIWEMMNCHRFVKRTSSLCHSCDED